ncbi:MAG: hypothetical protein ACKVQC_07835 [Elusimicrobiota bacterium]
MANWLARAENSTKKVAEGNREVIPIFWITIYGLLSDFADFIEEHAEFMAKHPDRVKKAGLKIDELAPVQASLKNLLKVFDYDELIYLQYRRHVECHPLQSAYRLRVRDGRLVDQVNHRLIKSVATVDETNAAIERVLLKFKIDENKIAENFAKRSLIAVGILKSDALPVFGLPS